MTGPLSLPIALSPSVVGQTLMRVGTAARYAVACSPSMTVPSETARWAQLIQCWDAEGLIQGVSRFGITPYVHLERDSRGALSSLLIAHPRLHAAFEEGAGTVERSIGSELPLILPVLASFDSAIGSLPPYVADRGMALFLDSFPSERPQVDAGLQIYHLTPEAAPSVPIPMNRFRKRFRTMEEHPAADAIAWLAQRDLSGLRVTPLSSGDVPLRRHVAHVGKFSFLGLDELSRSQRGLLQMYGRWSPVIDVLALGAYFATRESEARLLIETLRPRIVVMRTDGASGLQEEGDLQIARLNPRDSTASILRLDPKSEILSVTVGNRKTHFHAQKRDRWQTLLKAREAGVLEGATVGDGFTMNRVLKYAARYLYLLETTPSLYGRTEEKAENLEHLIDEMIEPLNRERDVRDHIRFFSEILHATGVID